MSRTFKLISFVAASTIVACSQPGSENSSSSSSHQLYSANPDNFRLSLTDAPNEEVKSVNVNIDHVELLLSRGGVNSRVIAAKNMGMVDLLQLRNGVTMPLFDAYIPNAVEIKQIRLVLKSENNHIIKMDSTRCDLKTPSAQHTGIKIVLTNPIVFESHYSYSIVVDFEADKSVVLKGNGDCLLKPVLKLKSATRLPQAQENEGEVEADDADEEDLTGGVVDSNTAVNSGSSGTDSSDDDSGFDTGTEDSSIITIDDPTEIIQFYQ